MIEAVIFDLDGTLAETEEIHRSAFNRAFADFGLEWRWDVPLYRELLKVTGGKERIAHFIATSGGDADPAFVADLHKAKTAIYTGLVASGGVPLRPGVKAFIDAARSRGLALAIATTTSARISKRCWAQRSGRVGGRFFRSSAPATWWRGRSPRPTSMIWCCANSASRRNAAWPSRIRAMACWRRGPPAFR